MNPIMWGPNHQLLQHPRNVRGVVTVNGDLKKEDWREKERGRKREGEREREKERGRKREGEREREKGGERVREKNKNKNSPVGNTLYPVLCGPLHRLLEDPRDVSGVVAINSDLKEEEQRERERESKLCKHIISPVGNPLNPIICGSLQRLLEDPRDLSRVVPVDGNTSRKRSSERKWSREKERKREREK